MERAVVIVSGRVQKVGYRDYVVEVAAGLDVNGTIENLDDGNVKIVAEAERKVLDRFVELLKTADDPLIKIIDLKIEFKPATGEYKYFDIKYDDFQKEGFERMGDAVRILKHLSLKQDQMLGKQDQMVDKQDRMLDKQDRMLDKQDRMLDSHDLMREDMNQNFTTLRQDYGRISDTMGEINGNLEKLTNAILKLAEKK